MRRRLLLALTVITATLAAAVIPAVPAFAATWTGGNASVAVAAHPAFPSATLRVSYLIPATTAVNGAYSYTVTAPPGYLVSRLPGNVDAVRQSTSASTQGTALHFPSCTATPTNSQLTCTGSLSTTFTAGRYIQFEFSATGIGPFSDGLISFPATMSFGNGAVVINDAAGLINMASPTTTLPGTDVSPSVTAYPGGPSVFTQVKYQTTQAITVTGLSIEFTPDPGLAITDSYSIHSNPATCTKAGNGAKITCVEDTYGATFAANSTITLSGPYVRALSDAPIGASSVTGVLRLINHLGQAAVIPFTIPVQVPRALGLTVTADTSQLSTPPAVGDVITYTFESLNARAVANVTFNTDLPIGPLSYTPSTGAGAANQPVRATGTVRVTQEHLDAGSVGGTTTASAVISGSDFSRNPMSAPVSVATPLTAMGALGVAASVDTSGLSSPVQVGDALIYTATVTNTGTATLTGVTAASTTAPTTPFVFTWPGVAGQLAPGESATGTASHTVTEADVIKALVSTSVVSTALTGSGATITSSPQTLSTGLDVAPTPPTSLLPPEVESTPTPPIGWDPAVPAHFALVSFTVPNLNFDPMTIRVIDATGASFTVVNDQIGYATPTGNGQGRNVAHPIGIPIDYVFPVTVAVFDGAVWTPGVSYTPYAPTGRVTTATGPWVVGGPSSTQYTLSVTAPLGSTVRLHDASGWETTIANVTSQNFTVNAPVTITGPITTQVEWGSLQGGPRSSIPWTPTSLTLPAPLITSVTGPDSFGRWTVTGTTEPNTFVRLIKPDGSTTGLTSTTSSASGAFTLYVLAAGSAPVYVYAAPTEKHLSWTQSNPAGISRYATIATLPGGPALAVTPMVDTSALSTPPQAGDVLTYTFEVENTGGTALTGVQVTPSIPGLGALTYTWPGTAGALAVGESAIATATYTVTQADIDSGHVAGTVGASSATATATTQSVDTPLTASAALTTTATVDTSALSPLPQAGDGLTYELTITNTGNVTLDSVEAAAVPAGVGPFTYTWPGAPGVLAPGQSVTATAPYTITAGDVSAGSVATTFTASADDPSGSLITSSPQTITTALTVGPPTIVSVADPVASGWDVQGTGVPGATVTVTPATGSPMAATVQPDGTWTVLVPLLATGPISATQALGANTSSAVTATLPGLPDPVVDPVGVPDVTGWDITGTGVPGATITITDQDGAEVTTTVAPDGTWSAALPLTTEGPVDVVQTLGPLTSNKVPATLPTGGSIGDPVVVSVTGPDASGWDIEGTGVSGATITITDQNGAEVTTTVAPDGTWSAALPLTTEGPVDAVQTLGPLTSNEVPATLPGLPGPIVDPVGAPDLTGWDIEGMGVPGATITITDQNSLEVTTTVAPDGTWSAELPLATEGPVDVVQTLGPLTSNEVPATLPMAGTMSDPVVVSVTGPDASGWDIEGTGVPGATITITDQDGTPVTTTVQPDGTWSAALPLPTDGPVDVVQTLGPLTSNEVPATLPGLDEPVVDSVMGPDASGWDIEGTGVPGATVTITDQNGVPVTTTVQPNGTWSAALPLTTDGPVDVVQSFGPVVSDEVAATLPGLGAPTVDPVQEPDLFGWDIEGTGEPGATITITDQNGVPVTTTVAPDGTWSAELPITTDGPVDVAQSFGPAVSDSVFAVLPTDSVVEDPTVDSVTGPDASGWDIEGTGEPGATITITDQNGVPVTVTVSAGGTWSAALPLTTDGPVDVVQTAGVHVSDPIPATLPGLPDPIVDPVGLPDVTGWDIEGTGVPGATITITDQDGAEVTATVQPDGTWSADLPLTTDGPVDVVQTLGPLTSNEVPATLPTGGSISDPLVVSVTGPDSSGWDIAGTGVPGATITITDQDGAEVTTTVQPDGTWSAALPLTTDGPVEVVQTLGPLTSNEVPATLPGLPDPTVNPVGIPDASGWDISGTGVPGATITIRDQDGTPVTTTVQPDGTWSAELPLTTDGPVAVVQSFGPAASNPVAANLPDPIDPLVITIVLGPDVTGTWLVGGTGDDGGTVTLTDDNGNTVEVPVVDGTWTATLPPSTAGPLVVTQKVGSYTSEPQTVELPVSALSLSASVDASGLSATPEPGDELVFTFTLTNPGDTALTGVAASSSIPGLTLNYAWPAVAGAIPAGGSVTATGTYAITQADIDAGKVTSTATAAGVNPAGGPVTAAPVATLTPIQAVAAIGVTVSSDVSAVSVPAVPGQLVAFSIRVTNTGTTTLQSVDVASSLPGISSLTYAWPAAAGVLAPGAHVIVTATYPITAADITASEIIADHTVTATGETAEGSPVTASQSVETPLARPEPPTIVVFYGPDEDGDWTVGGDGTCGAEVVITDANGVTTRVAVSSECTWTATLPPGTQGPINAIQEVGSVPSLPAGPTDLPTTAATLAVTPDGSALGTPLAVGDEVELTFVVTNTGTVPLANVAVATTVPGLPQAVFTAWPSTPGTLAPGASVSVTMPYSLTQADIDAGKVAGVATLSGTGPAGNAVATPTVTILQVLSSASSASMRVDGRINGQVAAAAPGVSVETGADVTWTVTVTNTGTVTLTNVVADSDGPSAASAALEAEQAAALIAPQGFSGSLAPGQSVVLSGNGVAAAGLHAVVASVTARVGTVQVAGQPVTLAGSATMHYTATDAPQPPTGGNGDSGGGSGLAHTGLDLTAALAIALMLAALGTAGVIVAARRRTQR